MTYPFFIIATPLLRLIINLHSVVKDASTVAMKTESHHDKNNNKTSIVASTRLQSVVGHYYCKDMITDIILVRGLPDIIAIGMQSDNSQM